MLSFSGTAENSPLSQCWSARHSTCASGADNSPLNTPIPSCVSGGWPHRLCLQVSLPASLWVDWNNEEAWGWEQKGWHVFHCFLVDHHSTKQHCLFLGSSNRITEPFQAWGKSSYSCQPLGDALPPSWLFLWSMQTSVQSFLHWSFLQADTDSPGSAI